MANSFEVLFMEEAERFVGKLPDKARKKLLYNLKKAQMINDSKLFKKLNSNIWEFRSVNQNNQHRLFAFWDNEIGSLVICTHGIIKKTQKTPRKEIEKAERLRKQYFDQK